MSVARGKATDFSCVTMKNMTMKGANFLEKLLDNQPVEWKKIGEVAELKRGKTITQKEAQKGNFPVISGGQKPAYYINQFNREGQTITIAGSGAYAGFVQYWEEPIFVSDAFSIKANEEYVLAKFIYHFLLNIQDKLYHLKRGSGVPHVYAKDVAEFPIPIPPLSVQSRIVEILDKFTSLEAELEAELELRKKQYAYYREQLLNFSYTPPSEFNVVYKKLGEVCKVQRGASPRPITKYLTDDKLNGIPWIKIGDTKVGEKYIEDTQERITQEGARKSRLLQKGDFVLSNSMSYGRPYILGISGCIHDGWASLSEISNSVLPDYLYYYLSSNEVQHYWTGKINSGSVSNLNSEIIKQLPIPLPPLSEQARIVEILDKFDTLTNSISEGLPLEIQLRRQQYEYYREQLLAFPHP